MARDPTMDEWSDGRVDEMVCVCVCVDERVDGGAAVTGPGIRWQHGPRGRREEAGSERDGERDERSLAASSTVKPRLSHISMKSHSHLSHKKRRNRFRGYKLTLGKVTSFKLTVTQIMKISPLKPM